MSGASLTATIPTHTWQNSVTFCMDPHPHGQFRKEKKCHGHLYQGDENFSVLMCFQKSCASRVMIEKNYYDNPNEYSLCAFLFCSFCISCAILIVYLESMAGVTNYFWSCWLELHYSVRRWQSEHHRATMEPDVWGYLFITPKLLSLYWASSYNSKSLGLKNEQGCMVGWMARTLR